MSGQGLICIARYVRLIHMGSPDKRQGEQQRRRSPRTEIGGRRKVRLAIELPAIVARVGSIFAGASSLCLFYQYAWVFCASTSVLKDNLDFWNARGSPDFIGRIWLSVEA